MSEVKHTPSPWLRDGNTIYALMHAGWRKGEELFKNRFHAYVQSDRDCPDGERDANARLIAAAPELLEALQGMIDLAKQMDDVSDEGGNLDKRFDAAIAAIAKATGA